MDNLIDVMLTLIQISPTLRQARTLLQDATDALRFLDYPAQANELIEISDNLRQVSYKLSDFIQDLQQQYDS